MAISDLEMRGQKKWTFVLAALINLTALVLLSPRSYNIIY